MTTVLILNLLTNPPRCEIGSSLARVARRSGACPPSMGPDSEAGIATLSSQKRPGQRDQILGEGFPASSLVKAPNREHLGPSLIRRSPFDIAFDAWGHCTSSWPG
jgi:hypothetical protein